MSPRPPNPVKQSVETVGPDEPYLGDSQRDTCGYGSLEFDRSFGHTVGSCQGNTETRGIMGNHKLKQGNG